MIDLAEVNLHFVLAVQSYYLIKGMLVNAGCLNNFREKLKIGCHVIRELDFRAHFIFYRFVEKRLEGLSNNF